MNGMENVQQGKGTNMKYTASTKYGVGELTEAMAAEHRLIDAMYPPANDQCGVCQGCAEGGDCMEAQEVARADEQQAGFDAVEATREAGA